MAILFAAMVVCLFVSMNLLFTTARDWSKVDFNKMEKDWEEGDDEAELEKEYEHIEKLNKMVRPKINMNDPESLKKAATDPLFQQKGKRSCFF